MDDFMKEINRQFEPAVYNYRHSDTGTAVTAGYNVVIWRVERFGPVTPSDVARWESWTDANNCTTPHNGTLGVDLFDNLQQKHVVVTSVHLARGLGQNGSCLQKNLNLLNSKLENLHDKRDLTVIAGDFNRKPDTTLDLAGNESPTNGLEPDPECWYRGFSYPHLDQTVDSPQDPTDPNDQKCSGGVNRYYDAVWMHPGSGGGTNPTATSFCEQWTHASDLLDTFPERAGRNSCTDTPKDTNDDGVPDQLPDGKLDNGRIDYIWAGWENDGTPYLPPQPVAAGYISYASADLGIDLDSPDLRLYSDHRAVQALLAWPPITTP